MAVLGRRREPMCTLCKKRRSIKGANVCQICYNNTVGKAAQGRLSCIDIIRVSIFITDSPDLALGC